jgi:nucleotide-binding universal stress UspA family protein
MTTREAGHIVVGVDGSRASRAALRWAVRQAQLTGAVIDAVTAWQTPPSFAWISQGPKGVGDYRAEAHRVLAEAVSQTGGVEAGVKIEPWVQEGHPAHVLIEASRGAQMLVVGSRGHGGFASALLGSVSQNCVHHASCPVLVVRETGAR